MQDPLWEREGKEESESYKESYGTYYDGNSDQNKCLKQIK